MTQHDKILALLSDGEWHRSDEFLYGLHLSQFHARIKELVEQKGYEIETGYFENEWNYKSYRLCNQKKPGISSATSSGITNGSNGSSAVSKKTISGAAQPTSAQTLFADTIRPLRSGYEL